MTNYIRNVPRDDDRIWYYLKSHLNTNIIIADTSNIIKDYISNNLLGVNVLGASHLAHL